MADAGKVRAVHPLLHLIASNDASAKLAGVFLAELPDKSFFVITQHNQASKESLAEAPCYQTYFWSGRGIFKQPRLVKIDEFAPAPEAAGVTDIDAIFSVDVALLDLESPQQTTTAGSPRHVLNFKMRNGAIIELAMFLKPAMYIEDTVNDVQAQIGTTLFDSLHAELDACHRELVARLGHLDEFSSALFEVCVNKLRLICRMCNGKHFLLRGLCARARMPDAAFAEDVVVSLFAVFNAHDAFLVSAASNYAAIVRGVKEAVDAVQEGKRYALQVVLVNLFNIISFAQAGDADTRGVTDALAEGLTQALLKCCVDSVSGPSRVDFETKRNPQFKDVLAQTERALAFADHASRFDGSAASLSVVAAQFPCQQLVTVKRMQSALKDSPLDNAFFRSRCDDIVRDSDKLAEAADEQEKMNLLHRLAEDLKLPKGNALTTDKRYLIGQKPFDVLTDKHLAPALLAVTDDVLCECTVTVQFDVRKANAIARVFPLRAAKATDKAGGPICRYALEPSPVDPHVQQALVLLNADETKRVVYIVQRGSSVALTKALDEAFAAAAELNKYGAPERALPQTNNGLIKRLTPTLRAMTPTRRGVSPTMRRAESSSSLSAARMGRTESSSSTLVHEPAPAAMPQQQPPTQARATTPQRGARPSTPQSARATAAASVLQQPRPADPQGSHRAARNGTYPVDAKSALEMASLASPAAQAPPQPLKMTFSASKENDAAAVKAAKDAERLKKLDSAKKPPAALHVDEMPVAAGPAKKPPTAPLNSSSHPMKALFDLTRANSSRSHTSGLSQHSDASTGGGGAGAL